ncbi:UNVERIFIED_CONTAM: hypothetical protein FKN15_036817 [Acipenser sinensis]
MWQPRIGGVVAIVYQGGVTEEIQDVGILEIPAELSALLRAAKGRQHGTESHVSEVAPPQVKAELSLSLPLDINSHPFSKYTSTHLQDGWAQSQDSPLQSPLTLLSREDSRSALEIYKLILRFVGDEDLHGWEEVVLGNYIAQRGLASPQLRNEILSQLAHQTWGNLGDERGQQAWLLLASCLGCFMPSAGLDKPLLKYVSDHGLGEYRSVCQHKILTGLQHGPEAARVYPATQLEWTANKRKGKMVLEVHNYNEEKLTAEVSSWTTGEQFAGWVLNFSPLRGLVEMQKGWSVSMFTGEEWKDLAGCDFVMDLIGETEAECSAPQRRPQAGLDSYVDDLFDPVLGHGADAGLDSYVDDLFDPVLGHGADEMERASMLSRRMKGGGGIGPNQPGMFPFTGTEKHTPLLGGYRVDHGRPHTNTFVIFAQQMTLQAMSLSQQQQLKQQQVPSPRPTPPDTPKLKAQTSQQSSLQRTPEPEPELEARAIVHRAPEPKARAIVHRAPEPEARPIVHGAPEPKARAIVHRAPEPEERPIVHRAPEPWAQQMTLQAMSLSQQQQLKQQQVPSPRPTPPDTPKLKAQTSQQSSLQRTPEPEPELEARAIVHRAPEPEARPIVHGAPEPEERPIVHRAPEPRVSVEEENQDPEQLETFRKKIEFFQKIGTQKSHVKKVALSKKIQLPKPASPSREEREPTVNEKARKPPEEERVESPATVPNGATLAAGEHVREDQSEEQGDNGWEQCPEVPIPPSAQSKPEPSRDIRDIIKQYQSRPAPDPKPFDPVRVPAKLFVKKNDPKEEALAILRMKSQAPPLERSFLPPPPKKTPSPPLQKKVQALPKQEVAPPPPLPPPISNPSTRGPRSISSIMKQKQQSLADLFSPSPTTATPPPLLITPPPPQTLPPAPPITTAPSVVPKMAADDNIKTQLHKFSASVYFSYVDMRSKLFLRKEVFYPREKFNQPYILNHLCEQIMRDTYSDSCIRITREERRKMRDLLATYLASLLAKGGNGCDSQILGVSHRGIRLLKVVKASGINPKHLKILRSYSYAELLSVKQEKHILEFTLKSDQLLLYSTRAQQIKRMINLFLEELRKESNHVIALRSFVTDDKSLLTFRKGDIIKLLHMQGMHPGWLFGSIGGRSGLFPAEYTQPTAPPDYYSAHLDRREERRKSMWTAPPKKESPVGSEVSGHTEPSLLGSGEVSQYVMTEFAMKYFREAASMESCMRGWRILTLIAGFFHCSNTLLPYVTRFLQDILRDQGNSFQEMAHLCKENLRRSLIHGGRRHIPSKQEMEAILHGKFSKRITIYLPGKVEHYGKINIFTVALELVSDLCAEMGVLQPQEIKEFAVYANRNQGQVVRPIRPDEYIFDFLLDDNSVTLWLKRVTWKVPLHFENDFYINVHYRQILSDYLEGKLLLPSDSAQLDQQVAVLAALQHCANGPGPEPTLQELKRYLPKSSVSSVNAQIILGSTLMRLGTMQDLSPAEAMMHFLTTVSLFPLFGSNVFPVQKVSDRRIPSPCIVGINQEQVFIGDSHSQELLSIPLMTVQSLRSLQPKKGEKLPGVEVTYGPTTAPKTITFHLKQAKEMCHVIVVILEELTYMPSNVSTTCTVRPPPSTVGPRESRDSVVGKPKMTKPPAAREPNIPPPSTMGSREPSMPPPSTVGSRVSRDSVVGKPKMTKPPAAREPNIPPLSTAGPRESKDSVVSTTKSKPKMKKAPAAPKHAVKKPNKTHSTHILPDPDEAAMYSMY